MKRKRFRLFQGHTDHPRQDGVGAALKEIFEMNSEADAEMLRLIAELKKIERSHHGPE
jgi:hypothetical protein